MAKLNTNLFFGLYQRVKSRLCIFVDALLIIKYYFIFLPALALYRDLIRPRAKFVLHQIAVSLDTLLG